MGIRSKECVGLRGLLRKEAGKMKYMDLHVLDMVGMAFQYLMSYSSITL